MYFFANEIITENFYVLTGDDAFHAAKSLRMKVHEKIEICDLNKTVHCGTIEKISNNEVFVKIESSFQSEAEPNVEATLFYCLPKSDKFDMVIQKSVELGIYKIVPVISERCICRPDEKSLQKKQLRWQKIAKQAAMQSKRGIIPNIDTCMKFEDAAKQIQKNDMNIIFYECGGRSLGKIIGEHKKEHNIKKISFFIGSEGGFDETEVLKITNNGGYTATLGNRILRTETAPIVALTLIMDKTGNLE